MSRAEKREREKKLNKIEETRRGKRSERNIKQKGRKGNPKVKVMSDRRKAFIKKANALFVLVYLVFCIYRISAYFSWKNIVLQMMNNEPSTIVDSSGNIIEKLGAERNKNNVKLSQVPDNLKNAYIDIEDERFYKHKGVDIKRTTAAIGSYVIHAGKSSFGGSTITQQLVKNLTGNDDNSISRKIEEWVKAEELESFCSKDEILETYFNIIYMPTFVINLVSIFIVKPFLKTFGDYWNKDEHKKLFITVLKIILVLFGVTLIIEIGCYILGVPVLSMFYGVDISQYKVELMVLIISGLLYAICNLLFNMLGTIRKQTYISIVYIITSIIAVIVSPILVNKYEMMGAVFANLLIMFILCTLLAISLIIGIKKQKSKGEKK